MPARAWEPARCAELVRALVERGHRVVVTGSPGERALTARVAGGGESAGGVHLADSANGTARAHSGAVVDLGGRTDLAGLADVLSRAAAVVVGNTGPAHLAAAVGTAVVSLFAPTVPAQRWEPWQVPSVLLGNQEIACAGCRARVCPIPGHPCLASVPVPVVVDAVERVLEVGPLPPARVPPAQVPSAHVHRLEVN